MLIDFVVLILDFFVVEVELAEDRNAWHHLGDMLIRSGFMESVGNVYSDVKLSRVGLVEEEVLLVRIPNEIDDISLIKADRLERFLSNKLG